MYVVVHGVQRRTSGSSELDFIVIQPCGCWELNSGPLEEQQTSLIAKPLLQAGPRFMIFEYVNSTQSPVNRYLVLIASEARFLTFLLFYLHTVSLDRAGFGAILTYTPVLCPWLLAVSPGQVLMVHLLSWQLPPPLVSDLLSLLF